MLGLLLIFMVRGDNESSLPAVPEYGLPVIWSGQTFGDYVYAVTLDGKFYRLDLSSGSIDYEIDTGGPLFNSTYSQTVNYFPSIDGYLVSYFPKYGYRRFPISIRDLVFLAPFQADNGEVFTSSKSTSLFMLDELGNLISSLSSQSALPLINFDENRMSVFRMDYALNILNDKTQVIRASEISIMQGGVTKQLCSNVTVRTSGSSVIVTRDGLETSFLLPGIPVSIIGANGVFDFQAEGLNTGEMLVWKYGETLIGVPSAKLKPAPNDGMLEDNLPVIYGEGGNDVNDTLDAGSHELQPFMYFKPLTPQFDVNRIANIMTETDYGIKFYRQSLKPVYIGTSFVLFVIYIAIRISEGLTRQLHMSMKFEINPDDPSKATFGGEECSIVELDKFDDNVLKNKNELTGLPTIRAIQPGSNGNKIFIFQLLIEYNYDQFNPIVFLQKAMICLQSLFKNGLVHGSIEESKIFLGANGDPLFGGYEKTIKFSESELDRANDVLSVGKIVRSQIDKHPEKYQLDPLLEDLLADMLNENFEERPRPEEILSHPLFYDGGKKMRVFTEVSEFINSPNAKDEGLQKLFNENYQSVIGAKWTSAVDEYLILDAQLKRSYDHESLTDLVAFIRNKYLHEAIIPDNEEIKKIYNSAEDYFDYFNTLFPNLFLYMYYFYDRYKPAS